jgi:hypothetical protein
MSACRIASSCALLVRVSTRQEESEHVPPASQKIGVQG